MAQRTETALNTAAETLAVHRTGSVRAILWGGLIAGALDLLYAFVWYGPRGVSPVRILQSIASGLLGADAYEGAPPPPRSVASCIS